MATRSSTSTRPACTGWAGLLGLLGISAPVAFNLILAAAWIGGTLGIFALAKRLLPVRAALLAAMLWAYALPRLQEVWSQGSLSQMTAVACVPWLALGILLTARQPSRRHAVVIALPLAGILLCHLPTAVLSALFAGPVIAFLVLAPARTQPRQARARLFGLGGGLLLGVGLAAIFLLPMVAELRYVSAATSSGADYLADNFLQLSDFFIQPRLLDVTDTRLVIAPTLGLVPGLLALAGLIGLLVRRRFGLAALLALGIAAMLLLAQAISTPLWLSVPFMSQLRFPWRSLYVGGLFAALAGGAALLLLPARWRTAGLLIGLLGVLGAALPWTYPARESLHWDRLTAADEIQVELDDHLRGLSSYDEFQPVWGASVPLDAPDVAAYADAPLRIGLYSLDLIRAYPDLQAEQLDDTTVRVTLTVPRPVRFRQYYYPGWTATLDGQPIEVYPEDEIGLITLDVPAGEHVIALHYAGTPVQAAGVLVTLGCLVLGAALIWTGRRQAVPDARPEDSPLDLRLVGALGAGVVLFAAIYAWVIIPHTDWLRLKSPPDAPLTMQAPVGATFGDLYTFLGYSLDQTRLPRRRAGRHALLANGGRAGWADLPARGPARGPESQRGVGRQPGQWRALPGHPAGPLLSDKVRVMLFEGIPPYVGRIKVQVVDAGSGTALRLPDGSDFLLLDPLVRVPGSNPAPAARLDYTLAGRIRLECATVQVADDSLQVELDWHVLAAPVGDTPGRDAPERDATVFIHALDADGQLVTQYNGPPLGGAYSTGQWQPGQHLTDTYSLPADPALTQLAVGMFWPDTGDRLAVTQGGQPVTNNMIPLPLETVACRLAAGKVQ